MSEHRQTDVSEVKIGIHINYINGEWSFWTLEEMENIIKEYKRLKRQLTKRGESTEK